MGVDPTGESKRVMNARILIPSADGSINVRLVTSSGEEIKAAWPGWDHAMFVNTRRHGKDCVSLHDQKVLRNRAAARIASSQEYRVEILTQNRVDFCNILQISKDDHIVIDASVCQVHKLPMKRQMEEIYSAEDYPESFFPRQKREFPNDGNFYSACSSRSDPTWMCPGCRHGYDRWAKRHDLKQ
ncbi:hypothetical protein [Luteolibacter sp. LG18]|uniref:hypothetical protein n=1 Tax=Luteolibacter sp. LG18 TaxID=2819286 RepID=UPI0030C70E77